MCDSPSDTHHNWPLDSPPAAWELNPRWFTSWSLLRRLTPTNVTRDTNVWWRHLVAAFQMCVCVWGGACGHETSEAETVPGAFEGEACVRLPPLLCWVTDVTCSSSRPPTTCPLVNSSALEANTSSPQCLGCHCCCFFCCFVFSSVVWVTEEKVLTWESTCIENNNNKKKKKQTHTQILPFAPGYVISPQHCQVVALQVQLD